VAAFVGVKEMLPDIWLSRPQVAALAKYGLATSISVYVSVEPDLKIVPIDPSTTSEASQ
jgi:hypothetical protein